MALDDCALARKLDPVRERFAHEYHATGNACEAYRRANPKSAKWTQNAVNVKASRVLAEAKVRLRLDELQGPLIARSSAKRRGDGTRLRLTRALKATLPS